MKKLFYEKRLFLRSPFDINLILVILFLNIFGIIMIYSASYYYAVSNYGYEPTYFMVKQIEYVVIGLFLMFTLSFIRPTNYQMFCFLPLLLCFGFILAVRVPGLGHSSHGAYRWIKIKGLTIQIAEPVKICCIAFLAAYLTRYRITETKHYLFVFGVFAAIALLLLIVTNNMSTAIIVFLIMFFTLMINFPKQRWFYFLMILGATAVFVGILYIDKFKPYVETESFRITRIRAWLHPMDEQFRDDEAYQATQALYAIGSGGFFGKGLGQSLIKFKLPEPHNDYILSIIFEELGIFGGLLLTFLYVYLLYKIFEVYARSKDKYCKILVLGVFLHFAIQVVLNYAVTLGLFPTMGVTLPFVSAGGASACFTLIELGLVLAVQRQNTEAEIYKEADLELQKEDPYYKMLQEQRRERKKEHNRKLRRRRAAMKKRASGN